MSSLVPTVTALRKKLAAEAKRGIIGSRAVNRAQDGMVASLGEQFGETGRTAAVPPKEPKPPLRALTVEDVNKALPPLL